MTDDVPLEVTGHEERSPPGEDGEDRAAAVGDAAGSGGDDVEESGTGAEESASDEGDDALAGIVEDVEGVEEPAADGDDGDGEAVQPVELLVQLAREGEIDPWDIDIVEVTDRFLARLRDSDLRTSGRALFYAAVLLRMKGDDLVSDDEPEPEEPEPWEEWDPAASGPEVAGGGGDPVAALETEMERRLERKRVRGQPETLEELVRELREAERDQWWKEARTYDTDGSPSGFGRGTQHLDYGRDDGVQPGEGAPEPAALGRTHDEDLEGVIDDVRGALREQYEAGREEVLYAEVADAGPSRVMTYLALLFLAHRGRVALRQDELFGDLWIRNAGAAAGTDEAVAD